MSEETSAIDRKGLKVAMVRLVYEIGNTLTGFHSCKVMTTEEDYREFRHYLFEHLDAQILRMRRLVRQAMTYYDADLAPVRFTVRGLLENTLKAVDQGSLRRLPREYIFEFGAGSGETEVMVPPSMEAALMEIIESMEEMAELRKDMLVTVACKELVIGGTPGVQVLIKSNGRGYSQEWAPKAFDLGYDGLLMGIGMTAAKRAIGIGGGTIEACPDDCPVIKIWLPKRTGEFTECNLSAVDSAARDVPGSLRESGLKFAMLRFALEVRKALSAIEVAKDLLSARTDYGDVRDYFLTLHYRYMNAMSRLCRQARCYTPFDGQERQRSVVRSLVESAVTTAEKDAPKTGMRRQYCTRFVGSSADAEVFVHRYTSDALAEILDSAEARAGRSDVRTPTEITITCGEEIRGGTPGVELSIKANSPGFSPAEAERGFEFGCAGVLMGIGTAAAKELVESVGGEIEACPDECTRFRIWIPKATEAPASSSSP